MKTFIVPFILLLTCIATVSGQKSYTLSKPDDNESKSYIARDYIQLQPGYSFNSAGGKTLYLGINEQILDSVSYQSASQLPNPYRTINTDYAVGTIAGDASVSSTGAAVYQIPIEVMPGTGSVQPNISIVYNSQSGNGLVGFGWSLCAVSAITRVGKTIYHNGAVAAPSLSGPENLMLDGQRLMQASVGDWLTPNTYKTEIESYLDIASKSLSSYAGYEVKNKEGWTMEYGLSDDSYIKPAGSSAAYAWLLKKVTDANGNYMTYTYDNDASTGEFRLKQIEYTGNDSVSPKLNPYNKIEFFYETRTDQSTSYIAGKSVAQSVILYRIKCSAYGSTIRDYRFNYYYDGIYSKLTEMEEYGQNGIRYNSTIINWGDYEGYYAKYGDENFALLSENRDANTPIYADFNGDGRRDFISVTNQGLVKLFLNRNSFGMTDFVKACEFTVNNYKEIIPVDLNGDGYMDLVAITSATDGTYRYNYYFFDGSTFSNRGGFNTTKVDNDYVTGDFYGDGKQEILIKSTLKLYNEAGNATQTAGIFNWGEPLFSSPIPNNLNLFDFTGNGKTNICIRNGNNGYIYELNGTTFTQILSTDQLTNLYAVYPGDYNGDGKADLFVVKVNQNSPDGRDYFWLLSSGNTFILKVLPNLNATNVLRGFTGDFNLDGKTDIAIAEYYTSSNQYYYRFQIGINNGSGYDLTTYNTNIPVGSSPGLSSDWDKFDIADFDGDGRYEACFSKYVDANIIHSFNDAQNLTVKNITNGLNQKISFEYHPITDNGYCGTASSSYTFPVCKFQQPLYVTTSIEKESNNNVFDSNYFYYKGGRIHKQGKGFLGFEEITATNYTQGTKTNTQYGYDPIYYNVYPVKQTVTTTSGDSILRTDFANDLYATSISKVIFPYVKSQTAVDKLTGISRKIDYTYILSDEGNPNKVTETQGNLITETNYIWEAKNSTHKNRITQQIINKKGIGVIFTETKKFEYDAKARLTKRTDYYGNAKAVTTNYSNYDNFGNPKTVTTSAANCSTVTASSTFDATGRFVETSTDALGNVSKSQYDAVTGVLLENTDIAGLKTAYQYDGFQKLLQKTTPTDNINFSTGWDISGNNIYKTVVSSRISGAQTTWYNALGLDTKTQSPGFSGAVVSEKEYKDNGQLIRSYLPGYGSKSSQYIQYDYDKFDRLQSENNLGRTTTYNYNGLTTTITAPDGTTRSTTLNLSGLVENSKDEAGNTVAYTYNSLGKPETITAAGATTYIKYDDRGFQRALKDVNMTDSAKYVYNAYGQLASQTNARGQTTSFLYDAVGRIAQESCPERTLIYQYVSSGNGVGQIQTIKEGNAIERSYGYTPLGQVSSVTEKIDNADYTTSYSYNALGQMQEQQSPSGMRTSYQYNGNGLLTSMRNAENNALLWQLDDANAMGQITESTLGNGLKRISGYDAYYSPNQILLMNGNSIIDLVYYNFNSTTGNLTSRNDAPNGKNETFGYDNLNRLTSLTLNGGNANSTSYYPNGNINAKFDVGTYQYDNGNHAVSGITNMASSYNPSALNISNTSYNRVSSLTQQGSIIKNLSFQYNPDDQRNKSLYYENGTLKKTMYYVGNYEKEVISGGSTKEYDYIYTPEGMSAIAVKTNGTRSFYYVQTDHLGSIRLVTDASKAVQTRYYYDAWGKQTLVYGTSITNRGYIGEEHLNEFGLLNLNARLYNPALGRFLEMDPYVQTPDYTQSFNRYLYGMNNPLKYSDPNGKTPLLAVGIFIVYMYLMNAHNNTPKGEDAGNLGNWAWNPISWFKPTSNNPNPNGVVFTVGGSLSGSDIYGSVAIGNIYGPTPAVGYSSNYGFGFGYNNNGSSSLYYPRYNYNAPEQVTDKAISQTRENWDFSAFSYASIASTAILADDVTGVGTIDDVLVPFVWAGATSVFLYQNRDQLAKMAEEISGIVERNLTLKNGFTYELVASNSGYYPNVRGGYVYLNTGDVWKYGETTSSNRYSQKYLDSTGQGLDMQYLYFGNQMQIKIYEKTLIYNYFFQNGTLPPGNRIFR